MDDVLAMEILQGEGDTAPELGDLGTGEGKALEGRQDLPGW